MQYTAEEWPGNKEVKETQLSLFHKISDSLSISPKAALDATDNLDGCQPLLLKYMELVVSMSKWYQRNLLGDGMLSNSTNILNRKRSIPWR